jgi:hypothetical protein
MVQQKRPGRPQTSKEARKNFNQRGGMTFTSERERKQLLRELEQEEAHRRQVQQEAARKEASKRKAEKEAQARQERRRLGIPEPDPHVRASQMRIASFLKDPAKAAPAQCGGGSSHGASDDEFEDLDTQDPELEASLRAYEAAALQQLSHHHQGAKAPSPEDLGNTKQQDSLSETANHNAHEGVPAQLSGRPPSPGVLDDWSTLFVTNSQIEREMECTPRPVLAAPAARTLTTPEDNQQPAGETHQPITADIALLLEAIPEHEFQRLDTEGAREMSTFLNLLPTQELDDYEG